MSCWRETAPAKVNLALDIVRRRPDGYHDLSMVMHSISLCDTLTLEEQPYGFTLETDGAFRPTTARSLEQRAAEAFFSAVGIPMPGLRVTLQKNIPAYAGLGGGSSDVAALLRALRTAYCPDLSDATLERVGLLVGSDVPFCVRGGAALASGRGEILTPLPSLDAGRDEVTPPLDAGRGEVTPPLDAGRGEVTPPLDAGRDEVTPPLSDWRLVLCKPPFGIPTPELFARADRVGWNSRPDVEGMADAVRRADFNAVAAKLCNVFEDVLPPEYGEVYAIRRRLLELGAAGAVMSGSGPTVYGLFRDAAAAQTAADTLRRTYPETYAARFAGPNF